MAPPSGAPAEHIPAAVRRRCAEVAEQASWVRVDAERVDAFAAQLGAEGALDVAHDSDAHDRDAEADDGNAGDSNRD